MGGKTKSKQKTGPSPESTAAAQFLLSLIPGFNETGEFLGNNGVNPLQQNAFQGNPFGGQQAGGQGQQALTPTNIPFLNPQNNQISNAFFPSSFLPFNSLSAGPSFQPPPQGGIRNG